MALKKKRGRPYIGGRTMPHQINVRLTDVEWYDLQRILTCRDEKAAEFVRFCITYFINEYGGSCLEEYLNDR